MNKILKIQKGLKRKQEKENTYIPLEEGKSVGASELKEVKERKSLLEMDKDIVLQSLNNMQIIYMNLSTSSLASPNIKIILEPPSQVAKTLTPTRKFC